MTVMDKPNGDGRPAQCRYCLHDSWLNGHPGCMALMRCYEGSAEPLCGGTLFMAFKPLSFYPVDAPED
jgi:hypothetical protein